MSRPSRRQLEVLQLYSSGLTREEIGRRMVTSTLTVKSQLEKIRERLQAQSNTHAVIICLARGYLSVDDIDEALDIVPEIKPSLAVVDHGDSVAAETAYSSKTDKPCFADVDVHLRVTDTLSVSQ